ncbi:hypothetical protein MKX01_013845 [Papaver californicum]|nr:hypothetical protein MKX01_013845 [Papaver californicum]
MELGELKNLQLGGKTKGSKVHPGLENWEPTIGNRDMVLSFPEQREKNKKFLGSFSSGKYHSLNFSNGGQHSCPNSEDQLARNGEASTELPSPEFIFTAKNFYTGTLLPNSLHRTTSLPVDAVD